MPRILNPRKLRKLRTVILKPVKVTARVSHQYVVQPIARPLTKLDRSTEQTVRNVMQTAKIEAEQQLRQTDTGQAVVTVSRLLGRAAANLSQYRLSARKYRGTKKQIGIHKQYARAPAKRELKKVRKQRMTTLQKEKKLHQTAKQKMLSEKLPKKNISKQNKAFRKYNKALKQANGADKKLYRSQQKIRKLSKPKSESGKMLAQSLKQSLRQQAAQNAGDNETAQAALKLSEYAAAVKQGGRQAKLQREKKRESKLKKRAGLADQKLKQRQSMLHKTSEANKKGLPPPKTHRSAKEYMQDTAKSIGRTLRQIAGKAAVPLVLTAFFCFSCAAPLSALLSLAPDSLWILGTYNTRDQDLSDAERYYLQQAYTMNANLIACGSESTWKQGLRAFGVDTDGYRKIPAQFNLSSRTADAFEFDVWKLWSFLCAYCYNYDAGTKTTQMWEYGDEARFAMDLLLKSQYEFSHTYAPDGYWRRVYTELTEADILDGFHAGSGDVIRGVFTFSDAALPAPLRPFTENHDGTFWLIYSLQNNEILNANDSFASTGWYIVNDMALLVAHKCKYQQNYELINTTALFYGIQKKQSFDAAIENILTAMNPEIYQYYLLLAEGGQTKEGTAISLYGGHQVIRSPILDTMRSLTEQGRILHDFGMDMPNGQKWGGMHCGLAAANKEHDGTDIIANSNIIVYAMFDGEVTAVDDDSVVLTAKGEHAVHLRMNDDTVQLRASYSAVIPTAGLSEGASVSAGDIIGYTTGQQECSGTHYDSAFDYLHITLAYKSSSFSSWKAVDPRLLIS